MVQPAASARSEVFVVELSCLSCGRELGSVRLSREEDAIPLRWQMARCSVCGGVPVRSGYVQRLVVEPEVPRSAYAVRMGRPPKWMVEQGLR